MANKGEYGHRVWLDLSKNRTAAGLRLGGLFAQPIVLIQNGCDQFWIFANGSLGFEAYFR